LRWVTHFTKLLILREPAKVAIFSNRISPSIMDGLPGIFPHFTGTRGRKEAAKPAITKPGYWSGQMACGLREQPDGTPERADDLFGGC